MKVEILKHFEFEFLGETGGFVGCKSGYFEGKYENAKLNLWQQALICRSVLPESTSKFVSNARQSLYCEAQSSSEDEK